MKAMVLAAGFGARLQPLTRKVPKPLFPIMNRPLLAHTIELLRSQEILDITVNVHHLPRRIVEYFGDGAAMGVHLNFTVEEEILGTAGGIKAAQKYLNNGPFLVINGDILVDINLEEVLRFHKEKGACLTLVARQDDSPEKYDPIEIDATGKIVHFVGASSMNLPEDTTRVMFTGIQIMEPEIFDRIPVGKFCGTTEDIFPEMIEEGLPVYGYLHKRYWIDTGTPNSYLKAHRDALDGRINLKWNSKGPKVETSGQKQLISGFNCRIAADAQVGPYAVLGNGCEIESGARIENSVLWDNVKIGAGARVEGSILGSGVTLEKGQAAIGKALIA